MSRSKTKVAAVLFVPVAALAVPSAGLPPPFEGVASAQREGAAPRSMAGEFVLAEGRSTVEARVDEAIEGVVNGMFFLIRGVARDRLRETNDIPQRVDVEISGEHVVVSYDGERYEGTDDAWEWIDARGKPTQLLVQREGPRLYLTFRDEQGQKIQAHTFSEDGRHMWLDVRVTSDQLPAPLTYRVAYRRA